MLSRRNELRKKIPPLFGNAVHSKGGTRQPRGTHRKKGERGNEGREKEDEEGEEALLELEEKQSVGKKHGETAPL